MPDQIESPIFVGSCTKTVLRGVHTDYFGVGSLQIAPVFPWSAQGISLLILVPKSFLETDRFAIRLTRASDPAGFAEVNAEIKQFTHEPIQLASIAKQLHESPPQVVEPAQTTEILGLSTGSHYLLSVVTPHLWLSEPDTILISLRTPNSTFELGSVLFAFEPAPQLSDQEVMAMLSDPHFKRSIEFRVRCSACPIPILFYETIDDLSQLPVDLVTNGTRISSLPDIATCSCGRLQFKTQYLKDGWRHFLRNPSMQGGPLTHVKVLQQHSASVLSHAAAQLREIVSREVSEESVQKFLESKPVFWNFLSPYKILHKPKLLGKFVADFGVLSHTGVLYFIEIEKPSTNLVTKKGGRHSNVQQAIDQIDDWRKTCQSHRLAVLDQLSLQRDHISDIRFLVVAGRSSKDAAKIRSGLPQDTSFMTFDELAVQVDALHLQLLTHR